jgi:chemotaxis response regulator CheB
MEKKKVMIVDDSSVMRLTIRNLLTKNDSLQVVFSASNGKEAMENLAATQPDLILLDIEMPEMDGVEFLKAVRKQTGAKIVILSSLVASDSPKVLQAKLLGANAVIDKPSGAVSADLEEKRGNIFWKTISEQLGIPAAM